MTTIVCNYMQKCEEIRIFYIVNHKNFNTYQLIYTKNVSNIKEQYFSMLMNILNPNIL